MLKVDPEAKTPREHAEHATTACLMLVLCSVRDGELEVQKRARTNLTVCIHAMNSAIIDEITSAMIAYQERLQK